MAFENLSDKLTRTFKNLVGKGKLSERNIEEMLQDIRQALLEADVNYRVVQTFLESIRERSIGLQVSAGLEPAQMVLKIVHEELVKLLGDEEAAVQFNLNGLTTIMLVGLQGTGKTTATAKIANLMVNKYQRKVLLVAADLVRPAAIEQLKILGQQINVEVFSLGIITTVQQTVEKGLLYAKNNGYNTVIIDTAGRLHINNELMDELKTVIKLAKPQEILLTADAMAGQDIVNVAHAFHEALNITGLIATKFDGDSRGGGILSVKAVTNVPIKYVSQGEKVGDLDLFYPKRMADRILGMGDMLTLIEQAQAKLDVDLNQRTMERLMQGQFTLNDMMLQFKEVRKLGPLSGIMNMLPGMGQLAANINDATAAQEMAKQLAILQSMTYEERENPQLLRASRKDRIAKGSGTSVNDVTKLLSVYEKTKKQMTMLTQMAKGGSLPDFSKMFKK